MIASGKCETPDALAETAKIGRCYLAEHKTTRETSRMSVNNMAMSDDIFLETDILLLMWFLVVDSRELDVMLGAIRGQITQKEMWRETGTGGG